MSQGDVSNPMDLVNGVCASAAGDAGLAQETELTIPEADLELASGGVVDQGSGFLSSGL